jgi:lysophospholipase L1-like esterase
MVAYLALVVGTCSAPATTPAPSIAATFAPSAAASPSPSATPEPTENGEPVGLVAIGHSGINSDTVLGLRNVSWATSTMPGVQSVYLRMVKALPETEGHVANTGEGGSRAALLRGQAQRALYSVPTPRLVLVYSIENDIGCPADETAAVTAYGEAVTSVLDFLTEATPASQVLMVSSVGRPAGYVALFKDRPDVRKLLGGDGACDMFDRAGNVVPKKVQAFTEAIELYEAEIARVCALYRQCHTDDGLFATQWTDDLDDLGGDWAHLNARGNAKLAAIIWPKVVEILGLPAGS